MSEFPHLLNLFRHIVAKVAPVLPEAERQAARSACDISCYTAYSPSHREVALLESGKRLYPYRIGLHDFVRKAHDMHGQTVFLRLLPPAHVRAYHDLLDRGHTHRDMVSGQSLAHIPQELHTAFRAAAVDAHAHAHRHAVQRVLSVEKRAFQSRVAELSSELAAIQTTLDELSLRIDVLLEPMKSEYMASVLACEYGLAGLGPRVPVQDIFRLLDDMDDRKRLLLFRGYAV